MAIATHLGRHWHSEPFTGFGPGEAQAFYRLFEGENALVAERYLHRPDGRLFFDQPRGGNEILAAEVELDEAEIQYVRQLLDEGLEYLAKSVVTGKPIAMIWPAVQ
ncbi:MAG: hypothetical protein EP312_00460 [Gammaproteobacteria bacterium]|nr:MAG: hypothetical protein EP312_00460 [Gammaproteobacteria bacterium]